MQVQLIVTNKSRRGEVISVSVPEFRIGRAEDCHFRLESSWVSPQHCVIKSYNDAVTILDTSGKKGTFVNSGRVSASQELKNGDKIRIGELLFVVSIGADTEQPATTSVPFNTISEQESGHLFEILRNNRSVSLTKSQLFELARKGEVVSDTVITVSGTKVFADSLSGIVFGRESSAITSPTVSEAQKPEPLEGYPLEKVRNETSFATMSLQPQQQPRRKPSGRQSNDEASNPFDISGEPHSQVEWVPGARQKKSLNLWKSRASLSQAFNNVVNRHVAIAGSVLFALCLLGVMVYFFIDEKSSYGAVRISGTLIVDGKPIAGANVTLHPRSANGMKATGLTNKWGKISVTTGNDPDGRGAVPGEYDVTFAMRPAIPREYENPKTSGLSPIIVEPAGRNSFRFDLSSASFAIVNKEITKNGAMFSDGNPKTFGNRNF